MTDSKAFILEAIQAAERTGLKIVIGPIDSVLVPLKPLAMQRCLANILENSRKYANTAFISASHDGEDNDIVITIDDGENFITSRRTRLFNARANS